MGVPLVRNNDGTIKKSGKNKARLFIFLVVEQVFQFSDSACAKGNPRPRDLWVPSLATDRHLYGHGYGYGYGGVWSFGVRSLCRDGPWSRFLYIVMHNSKKSFALHALSLPLAKGEGGRRAQGAYRVSLKCAPSCPFYKWFSMMGADVHLDTARRGMPQTRRRRRF